MPAIRRGPNRKSLRKAEASRSGVPGIAHEMGQIDPDLGKCAGIFVLKIFIENQVGIGRAMEPAIGLDFRFKLTG